MDFANVFFFGITEKIPKKYTFKFVVVILQSVIRQIIKRKGQKTNIFLKYN